MKKAGYIFLIVSIFIGCKNVFSQTESTKSIIEDSIKRRGVFIKDSSDYTLDFIDALNQEGIEVNYLIDSLYIIGDGAEDTLQFPELPRFGTWINFTGRKDNIAISVRIKRLNQNSIRYFCEIVEFGKSNSITNGIAEFGPFFYLGAETDINSKTGNGYLSTEYVNQEDNCYTYIKIGIDEDYNYTLCKLKKNCNGKIIDINLNNFPTLIEK